MPRTNRPSDGAIDEVKAELGKQRVTASANRRLVLVSEYYGYECSECQCRFPESKPPPGQTPAESRRLEKEHREREFAAHVCEDRGW